MINKTATRVTHAPLPKSHMAMIFLSVIYLQTTPLTIPNIMLGIPLIAYNVATNNVEPVI